MSDRRTCACGEWPIIEYGRWCPSCMGDLAGLEAGDQLLVNDFEFPITCRAPALRDADCDVVENPIFRMDSESGFDMELFVIDSRMGRWGVGRRRQLIWTFSVVKAADVESNG